jgi:hypothetical protein
MILTGTILVLVHSASYGCYACALHPLLLLNASINGAVIQFLGRKVF